MRYFSKLSPFSPLYLATLLLGFYSFLLTSCQSPSGTDMDRASGQAPTYQEAHRPQFHFSPPEKWMNDPNGMVYYDGEYHLFYQHYPDSTVWGPMHWGHAVSEDLVHWENLPIALYPDSLGYIFSGSAVVDENNTSGFGTEDNPPLIAIFTYHDAEAAEQGSDKHQTQAIAYSTDRGRSWTKYEANPVIENPGIRDFRDPKVFWHEPTRRWVMIFAALDRVRLYTSPNLIDWTFASTFGENAGSHGGVWECPDLFELPIEGSSDSRWVMLLSINPGGPNGGSATQYFIGDFDGETFTLDEPRAGAYWIDYGPDNYAGVTWAGVPESDGRRIFLGWMSNWDYANVVPTETWRSAMTVPRRLELHQTDAGLRLASRPVEELQQLRGAAQAVPSLSMEGPVEMEQLGGISPDQMELIVEFAAPASVDGTFGVELRNGRGERYRIGYNPAENVYFSDRRQSGPHAFSEAFASGLHTAPRLEQGGNVAFHFFFDRASAELFADDGATVLTGIFFPTEPFTELWFFSEGSASLLGGRMYALESIW